MLTRDGHRLHVTTNGPDHAPLAVFLAHCWRLNQHDWHYQVRDRQQAFGHGIRIVTWDHRGHGESDAVSRAATVGAAPLVERRVMRHLLFGRPVRPVPPQLQAA